MPNNSIVYTDPTTGKIDSNIYGVQTKTSVTVGYSNADYIVDGIADNVQIQQAIDFVDSQGGGEVRIKKGTFNTTAQLNIGSNTALVGEGVGVTILRIPASADISFKNQGVMLRNKDLINGNANITVKNLEFLGAITTAPTQIGPSSAIIFTLKGVANLLLENLKAGSFHDAVIITKGVFDAAAPNGFIHEYSNIIARNVETTTLTSGAGIAIGTAGRNILIDGYKGGARDTAVALFECETFVVTNCIIDGTGSFSGQGIEFSTTQNLSSRNGVVSNNVIRNYAGNGIYATGKTNSNVFFPSNIIVSDNVIFGSKSININSGGHGIDMGGTRNCTITNNICYGNDKNGINLNPGSSTESRENVISDNICYNNSQLSAGVYSGISVRTESSGRFISNTIENNRCFDNQSVKTQAYGVALVDAAGSPDTVLANNTIKNNNFTGNLTAAILPTGTFNSYANNEGARPVATRQIQSMICREAGVNPNLVVIHDLSNATCDGNGFRFTTTANDTAFVGVAMEAGVSGQLIRIVTKGQTLCEVSGALAAIVNADRLSVSTGQGRLKKAVAGETVVAIALAAATTNATISVILVDKFILL